jgi:two-component system, NtrC family, response regulator AtoC
MRVERVGSDGEVVIGRDDDCHIRLDHARISRRHARISVGPPCLLEDLGSRNGTRVFGNKVPAGSAVELRPGDVFAVGPFTCVLVTDAPAEPSGVSSMVLDDPNPATPPPLLASVAESPLTVLVLGETGVGKEILAETLHRLSRRAGRLVRINCASMPADLLESELFGHERGSFTGAVASKKGLLEAAAGGTVFLDEIGEMPLTLQAKLLRAIEAREITRVGAVEPIPVDVRFIAATNRDLPAQIEAGAFRLDLYFRLAVLTLSIAPLRDRRARLPLLATDLVRASAERAGRTPPAISAAAMQRLQAHRWPGNVRELRNVLERAMVLALGGDIDVQHIVIDPHPGAAPTTTSAAVESDSNNDERQRIIDALAECAGNQTRAAKALGMSRSSLATKLALYRIPRPNKPST